MTVRKIGVHARTVCVAAAMFALASCATTSSSNPYAGVGYAGPAYTDADACYYPGYVGVCNPYVYGPYWDGFVWRRGWHYDFERHHDFDDFHGARQAFHDGFRGGFGMAHGGLGTHGGHGGFGGGHGRG
jgi:hypothetical protein